MESRDTPTRPDDSGLRRPRRHAVVWLQLLGLLALLTPLFASIGAFVAGDRGPAAAVTAPESAPVIVEVPVERVVERIVYVQPNAPTGATARQATTSSPPAPAVTEATLAVPESSSESAEAAETAEDAALEATDEDNAPRSELALAPILLAPREVWAPPIAPAPVYSPPVPVYASNEVVEADDPDDAADVEDDSSLTALMPEDSPEEVVWDEPSEEPSQEVVAPGRTEVMTLTEVPSISGGSGEQAPNQIVMMTGSVVYQFDDDGSESTGEEADAASADEGAPEDGVGEQSSGDDLEGSGDEIVVAMVDEAEDELARAPLEAEGEGSEDGISDDVSDDGSGIDQIEILVPAGD